MKIFLVIAMLISGTWVSGKDLDYGWHPLQFDNLEDCLGAAKFYNDRADIYIKGSHRVTDTTAFCVVVSEENTRYD